MPIVKKFMKQLVFFLAVIVVLPLIVIFKVSRLRSTGDATFQASSQLLCLVPTRIGTYLRAAFYFSVCNSVDRQVSIGFVTLLSHSNIDIGQHVYIGAQCNIGSCSIGADCLLGSGVHVLSGKYQHQITDVNIEIRNQPGRFEKIVIGNNCWIGNNSTVMAAVGSNTIIAAGSVVVNDIPANSIAAGNPAKVIKLRE